MAGYGFQAVQLHGTIMSGTQGVQVENGRKVISPATDGRVHQTQHYLSRTAPKASIKTIAIATWLAALNDSTDCPVKALNGTTGLDLFGALANDNTGPGYSASNAVRRRFINGLLLLKGISWAAGGSNQAVAEIEALFRSATGSVQPWVDSVQTLPSQPTPVEMATLTSLTINGVSTDEVSSFDLTIDHKAQNDNEKHCYSGGYPHPVRIDTAGINGPLEIMIKAKTRDIGAALEGTSAVTATFTNLTQGGSIGTTGFILTLNGVWTLEEGRDGESEAGWGRDLVVRSRHDGTNRPLTWSTF